MILEPIRPYMTSPKIIYCPDGHYCQAIFSLGPYIADYPEQCLLASIVQGWCPMYAKLYSSCLHTSDILCFRYNAPLCDMDSGWFIQCSEVHPELLCESYGLQELWDDYGIVGYIKVMFFSSSMYNMWTNIAFIAIYYPLSICRYPWFTLSWYSTSTHQRCFQRSHCHLGKWLYQGHSFWSRSQEDSRWYWPSVSFSHLPESTYLLTKSLKTSLAPSFAGLHHFPQGQVFVQWTGDDSKALMKVHLWIILSCIYWNLNHAQVYLLAIQGYVPDEITKALQAFLDFCYIVRCDVHDDQSLSVLQNALDHFHKHCKIFRMTGVCPNGFNLPQSHSGVHYMCLIQAFGAPNSLCSSTMELKYIVAVKEPWQHSSWWNALKQVLTTNPHLDKLAATWVDFTSCGMLEGTVLESLLWENYHPYVCSCYFSCTKQPIWYWQHKAWAYTCC